MKNQKTSIHSNSRLTIKKTYKIYIGGKFPRTESGRYYKLIEQGNTIANVCLASKKDIRDAVAASRLALSGWSATSAFNKSQIIYRIAEMLEGRSRQFIEELVSQGYNPKKAKSEVELCVDRIVYYAGWADKYCAMFSSVNPVSGSYFNFSVYEPTGVVGVICSDNDGFIEFISNVIPAIVGGNTVVCLSSEKFPLCAVSFAEVLHTSDLPGGVLNIITGKKSELLQHFAMHLDVNQIIANGLAKDEEIILTQKSAENIKRINLRNVNWTNQNGQNPYFILNSQEIKTTWHPIENIGAGANTY